MISQLPGTPTFHRWVSGVIMGGIGTVTGLAHLDHLLEDIHTVPVVSSILFPLGLSGGMVYAGYWLGTTDYSGEQAVTVAVWSIVGAVALTLLGFVILAIDIILQQHSVPLTGDTAATIVLPSSVTEGTAIGFAYGVYATWRDDQGTE